MVSRLRLCVCVGTHTLPAELRQRQEGSAVPHTPSGPLCLPYQPESKAHNPTVYLPPTDPLSPAAISIPPECLSCHSDDHSWLFRPLPSQVAHCRLRLAQPINSTVLTDNDRHLNQLFQETTLDCLEAARFFPFLCSGRLKARVATSLWSAIYCASQHCNPEYFSASPALGAR